jgi:hypothetical protein
VAANFSPLSTVTSEVVDSILSHDKVLLRLKWFSLVPGCGSVAALMEVVTKSSRMRWSGYWGVWER